MDAIQYLDHFLPWKELDKIVSDEDVTKYINHVSYDFFRIIIPTLGTAQNPRKIIKKKDIEGCSARLHEKKEINLFLENGYSIDEITHVNKHHHEYINLYEKLHPIAVKQELGFMKFIARYLDYDESFGDTLLLTMPLMNFRFDQNLWRVTNFTKSNINGQEELHKPSFEEVEEAMDIHKKHGTDYRYKPDQIYAAINKSFEWFLS